MTMMIRLRLQEMDNMMRLGLQMDKMISLTLRLPFHAALKCLKVKYILHSRLILYHTIYFSLKG